MGVAHRLYFACLNLGDTNVATYLQFFNSLFMCGSIGSSNSCTYWLNIKWRRRKALPPFSLMFGILVQEAGNADSKPNSPRWDFDFHLSKVL